MPENSRAPKEIHSRVCQVQDDQTVDHTIQQINLYLLDSVIGFPNTYPLHTDLLNTEKLRPGVSLQSLPGYILISEKIGHMKALEATITITLAARQENLSNDLKIVSNNGIQAKMHLQSAT